MEEVRRTYEPAEVKRKLKLKQTMLIQRLVKAGKIRAYQHPLNVSHHVYDAEDVDKLAKEVEEFERRHIVA